jgi:hypothetical protein
MFEGFAGCVMITSLILVFFAYTSGPTYLQTSVEYFSVFYLGYSCFYPINRQQQQQHRPGVDVSHSFPVQILICSPFFIIVPSYSKLQVNLPRGNESVSQLPKKFYPIMELEVLLPRSEEHTTGPYLESVESSAHSYILNI